MRFDSNVSIKVKDAFRARHEPEAERFLGTVYWAFLMTCIGIVILASVGLGLWEFMRPLDGGDSSVTVGAKKFLTRTDIEKVLQAFDARTRTYEARRAAPILVKDPGGDGK